MTIIGTVRGGKIELPPDISLPEGMEVTVDILQPVCETKETSPEPTLRGVLKFAGAITDLPPDSSRNVDHYLYGAPKVD